MITCLDSNSRHSVYSVMNFLASRRASMKPSATNMISQISSKSGTTIAHGLTIIKHINTKLYGLKSFILYAYVTHLLYQSPNLFFILCKNHEKLFYANFIEDSQDRVICLYVFHKFTLVFY